MCPFAAYGCDSEHGRRGAFEKGDDGSVEFEGELPLCGSAGTARSQPEVARRRRVSSSAPRRSRRPLGCAPTRKTELGRLQRTVSLSPLAVVGRRRSVRLSQTPHYVIIFEEVVLIYTPNLSWQEFSLRIA